MEEYNKGTLKKYYSYILIEYGGKKLEGELIEQIGKNLSVNVIRPDGIRSA